jgi:hypothetical protein
VIFYNLKNCIGYVLPWVVLGGVFAAVRRYNRRRPAEGAANSEDFPGLWWCVMTVAVYCGGYCFINLESRYLVTVITPLLCLGAMLVVCGPARWGEDRLDGIGPGLRQSKWWVIPMILLVSLQDVNRLVNIPREHPQSARLAPYRAIAEQLIKAQILPKPFAANRWHAGLYVSYAAGAVRDYLGAPLPNAATDIMEQLKNSGAAVYLRWRPQASRAAPPGTIDAFVPAAPWTLALIIRDSDSPQTVVEVYALPGRRSGQRAKDQ